MLWKIVFVGALVAAGIALVPPLLEGNSPASDKVKTAGGNLADGLKETAQNEIKESGIDKEELAEKTTEKGEEYLKKGAKQGKNLLKYAADNPEKINGDTNTIVPSRTVSHKVKPEELHTIGFVFESKNGVCQISAPSLAETVNGRKQLTRIFNISECEFEQGQPVIVKKTNDSLSKEETSQPDSEKNNDNNGDSNTKFHRSSSPISSLRASYEIVPVSGQQKQQTQDETKGANDQSRSESFGTKYESIELSASRQQNGHIELSYNDPSKDTNDIVITMKDSQKRIISAKYTVPDFETIIGDVSSQAHLIEAQVKHNKYGNLFSSVYVPAGDKELTVKGAFVGP